MSYNLACRDMIHCDYYRGCKTFFQCSLDDWRDAGSPHWRGLTGLGITRIAARKIHGWETNVKGRGRKRLDFCPEHKVVTP